MKAAQSRGTDEALTSQWTAVLGGEMKEGKEASFILTFNASLSYFSSSRSSIKTLFSRNLNSFSDVLNKARVFSFNKVTI